MTILAQDGIDRAADGASFQRLVVEGHDELDDVARELAPHGLGETVAIFGYRVCNELIILLTSLHEGLPPAEGCRPVAEHRAASRTFFYEDAGGNETILKKNVSEKNDFL